MPQLARDKKTSAIKLVDGQPLNRVDLQYDLLHHIFSDDKAVFTDINTTIHNQPPRSKVTFRDLYLNTLLRSPKCSRGLKEKALDNPDFGTEFAKIALLTNAGRINTTMAFFPELRTALRTYHPVPSLQKTVGGSLQDAPRIKSILKDCHLPSEGKGVPPPTPSEILSRVLSHQVPATTLVNLLFSITHPSHAALVARSHFEESIGLDWSEIFMPVAYSSASRARAFLWLCYHYVESISFTENPYADDYSKKHHGRTPFLTPLTPEEMALENVDSPEELTAGLVMADRRKEFSAKIKEQSESKAQAKEREKEKEKERGIGSVANKSPGRRESAKLAASTRSVKDRAIPAPSNHSRISTIHNGTEAISLRHCTSDIKPSVAHVPLPSMPRSIAYALPPPEWPQHTLLDNAFHLALTTDPLADSGEEDEDARCDYIFRLHVVNRLRGRQPTPEPGDPDFAPSTQTPIDIVRDHNGRSSISHY